MTALRIQAPLGQSYRSTQWMDRADCRDLAGFTEWGPAEYRPVCAECPVQQECLDYGVSLAQPRALPAKTLGVQYGGQSPEQLVRILEGRARTVSDIAAKVEQALASGMVRREIHAHLGYTQKASLIKRLRRAGRGDLVEALLERPGPKRVW